MADNVDITPGSGAKIATDECVVNGVTVQVPRNKMGWGVDGAYVDASATNPLPVTVANTSVAVTAASLPLPSGAATSAAQTTGNASLSSIDGKLPSLGQALAAASVPIVLTAAQLSTLTPPAAITGYATESTLSTLSGKVTACNTGAVVVSSSALPSGAATSSLQSTGNTSLNSIDTKITACNTSAVVVASGSLAATQSGTWTVTSNAGTGTFTVAGNAASGASDTGNPVKVGGVYNTSAPTLTNAQRGDLQLDANGLLKVAIASGGGSGGTASSFGSSFPSTGTAVGALNSAGTNMAALNLDASGYLKVNVAAGGAGGGAVTNAGTFAVQDSQLVAQNSTTSGQVGPLAQGAVTTAAPTYTTAKTSPLSLTTAGALRVDASATTQPVSGTFWQATQPVSLASVPSHAVTNAGTFATQAAQSGTWTVQPGNTANTTAWLVTGTGGTFPATQSGTWNVTNVSGTVSLPTGASTAAKQPALGTAGTASSDVITVQGIASMTALKVDGSAVTQPVSGTFWQATQPVSIASAVPVTDNSGSLTVDAPVGTPVYVRLSDGASAISTLPVSLASVPSHAVTNAGTFAVQSTLQTGANTIGYVNSISAGDTIEIAGTTYTVKNAFANATSSGNTTVVTAVTSKKIRVLAFSVGPVSAAVNIYFNNATTGAICSTKYLGVNGGMGRGLNHFGHFTTGTNNEDLRVNLSTTANVGVDVLYIEV